MEVLGNCSPTCTSAARSSNCPKRSQSSKLSSRHFKTLLTAIVQEADSICGIVKRKQRMESDSIEVLGLKCTQCEAWGVGGEGVPGRGVSVFDLSVRWLERSNL